MYQSALSASGKQASDSQNCNGHILTLLTSEELENTASFFNYKLSVVFTTELFSIV